MARKSKEQPEQEVEVIPVSPEEVPPSEFTRDEITMATLAHGSILLTAIIALGSGGVGAVLGVLVPFIIWLSYREKSTHVALQALQATVYQVLSVLAVVFVTVVVGLLVGLGWIVSGALTSVLVGLCLMPFNLLLSVIWVVAVVGLPLAALGYGLYAAYRTYHGEDFRYWLIGERVAESKAMQS